MRAVPEPIKLALADSSLPIKKRILMYRRVWNADELKYALESIPIDVTELLVEAGSIKMALDTDEVDKWDASNVTLTFNNDLNCFKEGLKGGLFENAVLWGSKFEYKIGNASKDAPDDSITVFTGYIYSSPVFRDNGNQIELTATSSLDALEYVSAEDFCLSKTDEPGIEVAAENSKDQGKTFSTTETGVGYVDSVKYGETFDKAQVLAAGDDYEVSDLNEYAKPASVKLKFTPTDGYQMWLSYRYWHKDMKIEDIVNALLDLAGVEKRQVEKALFDTSAKEYVANIGDNNYNLYCGFDENGVIVPQFPRNDMRQWYPHNMNWCFSVREDSQTSQILRCRLPLKGALSVGLPIEIGHPISFDLDERAYGVISFLDRKKQNGIQILFKRTAGSKGKPFSQLFQIVNGVYSVLATIEWGELVCINFNSDSVDLFTRQYASNGYVYNTVLNKYHITGFSLYGTIVETIERYYHSSALYDGVFCNRIAWREEPLTEDEYKNKTFVQLFNSVFTGNGFMFCETPEMRISGAMSVGATSWSKFYYSQSIVNNGVGEWTLSTSNNGCNWSDREIIKNNDELHYSDPYLRLYLKITSYPGYITAENISIGFFISYSAIPLVNLSDLTVGEAITQLAKMVSYEIGFNQDGVFFFRSRQGRYTDVVLVPDNLVETDNHTADIDSLSNRVTVEYGNFKTTVDDFTEGKPRPNSIDVYGVHKKSISDDNFIPADNVDISQAVAKANYNSLSVPGYTLQADCRPDLSLELGDKITVCSENTGIADKTWSDYNKFLKLPVWKRVFKVMGIELSFDKRLMTLNLKDVTSDNDVPSMEYNGYQTHFPTKLNYKE